MTCRLQKHCGMRKQANGAVEDCWKGGSSGRNSAGADVSGNGACAGKPVEGIIGNCAGNGAGNEGLAAFERPEDRWAPVRGEHPRCLDRRLATLASAIVDEQQNRFVSALSIGIYYFSPLSIVHRSIDCLLFLLLPISEYLKKKFFYRFEPWKNFTD